MRGVESRHTDKYKHHAKLSLTSIVLRASCSKVIGGHVRGGNLVLNEGGGLVGCNLWKILRNRVPVHVHRRPTEGKQQAEGFQVRGGANNVRNTPGQRVIVQGG